MSEMNTARIKNIAHRAETWDGDTEIDSVMDLIAALKEAVGLVREFGHDEKGICDCCGRRIDDCKATKGGCRIAWFRKRYEGLTDE